MATAKRPAAAVTELLHAVGLGDLGAREELIAAVYQEMRRLARRILAGDRAQQMLAPTELVHGAALKMLGQEQVSAHDRAHFLAYSGQVMRQVLIDHVRREGSAKRDAGLKVTLLSTLPDEAQTGIDVEGLHDALDKLAEVSPELAKLVEMRYFGGMTIDEIATVQGCSAITVKRQWRVARTWLLDALS